MKKSKTRLFVNKNILLNMIIDIKEKQYHFLKNVLRSKLNDEITLFDNITGEWNSKIIAIDRDKIALEVLEKNKNLVYETDIWLAFAPIKQHRLNIVIQKATELGVGKLIPCITSYTNNSVLNYKNLKQNIIEAAEQSQRLTLPQLESQITLYGFLEKFPKDRALIFCNEKFKSKQTMFYSILKIKDKYKKWALLIGPEGGFSEDEENHISNISNCFSISLGQRILRSDTAITASLFCLQSIIESS